MPAPLVVPFNFQPVNSTVLQGNYTVPVGKYGIITPSRETMFLGNFQTTNANATKNFTDSEVGFFLNSQLLFFPNSYLTTQITNVSSGTTWTYTLNMPTSAHGAIRGCAGWINNHPSSTTSTIQLLVSGVPILSQTAASDLDAALSTPSATGFRHASAVNLSGTYNSFGGVAFSFDQPPFFWVKAGDVIAVNSTYNYLFTEYNQIS